MSRRDEHREQFAARYRNGCAEGMGHVELAECPMCGWLEWRSLHRDKPIGVSVMPMRELRECDLCREAFSRDPELCAWVVSVIEMKSDSEQGEAK